MVQLPGVVRDQVRDAVEQARTAGHHAAAVRAMRVIAVRLETDAFRAGEPIQHLTQMRMTLRKLAVAPLYVEYAVHDRTPLVVVRRVMLLSSG